MLGFYHLDNIYMTCLLILHHCYSALAASLFGFAAGVVICDYQFRAVGTIPFLWFYVVSVNLVLCILIHLISLSLS